MTAPGSDEQIVAELAEALDDTATGLWMGQDGPGWGRTVAAALLPVVRRAQAEALREAAKEIVGDGAGGFDLAMRRLNSADILTARADALGGDR